MTVIRILSLLCLLAASGCAPAEKWGDIQASDPAPSFQLKDLSGKTVRSEDLRGKVLLMDFWATYCDTCRASLPALQELHTAFAEKDLVVLGVSIDTYTGHLKQFAQETGMGYTVLQDSKLATSRAYGVRKVPETFLVGKDGVVRKKWISFGPQHAAQMRAEIETALREKS
ncbi:MAG: TlpA disulfide reductase family protein [Elusimicrobiota bacterium]